MGEVRVAFGGDACVVDPRLLRKNYAGNTHLYVVAIAKGRALSLLSSFSHL